MKFILGSLLLVLLLVSSFPPAHGFLESNGVGLKCKCMQMTSSFILQHITWIQMIPPGNGCPDTEIIAFLKNKSTICLNPKAKRIQNFLKELWKRKLQSQKA